MSLSNFFLDLESADLAELRTRNNASVFGIASNILFHHRPAHLENIIHYRNPADKGVVDLRQNDCYFYTCIVPSSERKLNNRTGDRFASRSKSSASGGIRANSRKRWRRWSVRTITSGRRRNASVTGASSLPT